jgi:hypothetical protein
MIVGVANVLFVRPTVDGSNPVLFVNIVACYMCRLCL